MSYAELHCLSNFSFLRGASHPQELVAQADELGYQAIAITDECSLAGIVRAWNEAKKRNIKLICGAEFRLQEGLTLVILAPQRQAYAELCQLISQARLRSRKGEYRVGLADIRRHCQQGLLIWRPDFRDGLPLNAARKLHQAFPERLWIGFSAAGQQQLEPDYLQHQRLSSHCGLPLLACGNVHMHVRQRKPLQDVLTAIRLGQPVTELGTALQQNSESYLKPLAQLRRYYPEALLQESCRLAQRCHFELDEISYQYPEEALPKGRNASEFLRELSLDGARRRWPEGVPDKVFQQIERELGIIKQLGYEHYFLTVYDIVQFARSQRILCQGRGSAANSAVCYCLHITEVDPSQGQLLFERFISPERDEEPDIDVDFEHERREEVIQYIYRKYGRERAALAATVITYRRKSAIRDVGKALGLDDTFLTSLSKNLAWWDKREDVTRHLQEARLDISGQLAVQFAELVETLLGFPRHLSQHVGGFVIARDPIASLVPQENAAMADRTLIQWDKEDLESLGLMKVDILALGMLSALRKSIEHVSQTLGAPFALEDIPKGDRSTYDMLCKADSVGVFQVESRAQMTMLPRLQPRCFYDLVIQIAIVRPGPIQGGMVHPFLRRRQGLEAVRYENNAVQEVLERTLGVPIFQEQVIKLAMVAAGFSGGEADQLRRAMASWGRNGHLESFRDKLIEGMLRNGYEQDFAERLFSQMKGFGAYGFPESHSASFAILAYASAWIKRHYPAEFFCGLLNSLPMGFYSPSQLCQDAKRHKVAVRPICVNHSQWDHSLEYDSHTPALRLGFRLVNGLSQATAERLCETRNDGLFRSPQDLSMHLNLDSKERQCLVRADAFHCFDSHRYQSLWQLLGQESARPLLPSQPDEEDIQLPAPSEFDDIRSDYRHLGLTLRKHPLKMLRSHKILRDSVPTDKLIAQQDGQWLSVSGLVTCRQRPGTASGVLFITLEDECGNCNVIVWAAVQQQFRREILTGQLLRVSGQLQISHHSAVPVIHLVAHKLEEHNALLQIQVDAHNFH
ncbi:error-prone DNA polymerase [Spongiibacter taiwanensis]|uniref:error-prone DNA polymerase n=1 Tax=Spongiibacter taiwanensis TaxID=1748242 RepID=UPI00203544BD|nr:error-prone DNA polymerase [Spongiibacter taiwanensis]USA43986.1 error-prone DNA polymerase [Spongiibacter taiwanensis]